MGPVSVRVMTLLAIVAIYMAIGLLLLVWTLTEPEVRADIRTMHPVSLVSFVVIWMLMWPLLIVKS